DITPLQQYKPEIAQADVHLYNPEPANHTVFGGGFFGGPFRGQNPPSGAVIYYSLKNAIKKPGGEKPAAAGAGGAAPASTSGAPQTAAAGEAKSAAEASKEQPAGGKAGTAETSKSEAPKSEGKADAEKPAPITLEILDQQGKVIRKYPPKKPAGGDEGDDEGFGFRGPERGLPTEAGLNRFVWDMRYEGASRVPKSPLWGGGTDGPEAVPGQYQVRLTVQGKSYTAPLEIKADPRLKVTQADLQKQLDLLLKIRDSVTQAHDTINQIREVRGQIEALNKRLTGQPQAKAVADAGKALDKKMTEVEEVLIQTKAKSGQDVLNYPIRLNNYLVALGGVVESADTQPTQASIDVYNMLSKQLAEQMEKWKQILATDIPAYNNTVKQQDVPAIVLKKDDEKGTP
ncbi:MAG TPA: hypothetical protein VE783_05910, partial [Candidatus Limnocylindrales bacterium]|nr:hypothetical protein [Candidatus Limnocylindrales bacterium]